MIKIILGFIAFFVLIYFAYRAITSLDDNDLEGFTSNAAIIAACAAITTALVSFVILSF